MRISPESGWSKPNSTFISVRLAGAVLAEEAVDLALLDGEVHVVVRDERPETLGDADEFEPHDASFLSGPWAGPVGSTRLVLSTPPEYSRLTLCSS